MGRRYQETVTIPFDMVDVQQTVKLSAFLSQCLAVSGRQSEAMGRGDLAVYQQFGLIWVVTDYDLRIRRLPVYRETVRIETEAVAYTKYVCHRQFWVYSEDGQLLVEVACYFALIDAHRRTIARVPDDLLAPYQAAAVTKLPRLLRYQELKEASEQELVVGYFDLDLNGHVTNGKYLDWFYGSLGYDFLLEHRPVRLHLRYAKEIAPKQVVRLRTAYQEGVSRHEIADSQSIYAQAVIEWEDHVKEKGEQP